MTASRLNAGLLSAAIAFAAMLTLCAPVARAQGPMPDSGYGSGADSYRTPLDLQMPAPDDGSIPRSVTIPIPGGGSVQVDGPDAPADNPPSALSQWGMQQQNPNSSGTGPLGP